MGEGKILYPRIIGFQKDMGADGIAHLIEINQGSILLDIFFCSPHPVMDSADGRIDLLGDAGQGFARILPQAFQHLEMFFFHSGIFLLIGGYKDALWWGLQHKIIRETYINSVTYTGGMANMTMQQLFDELKKIEENMATKKEIKSLIDTIEIMSNPDSMKQIASSMKD